MALSTRLLQRLNCEGYKNWMKAGYCLHMLQSRLQGYIDAEMRTFHRQLVSKISPAARQRYKSCRCRVRGKQFHPECPVCREWTELILDHHKNRNGDIHWGNCNPSLWPVNYWEVAKVYLPRGHTNSSGPQKCDAAALLNLINSCDHFKVADISRVREIIKCRNDLMHSYDLTVDSSWLKDFGKKIQELITELRHVPSLVNEAEQLQEVLTTDWSVEDLVTHEVDGIGGSLSDVDENVCFKHFSLDSLSLNELEIELLCQLLEELYLQKEEHEVLSEKELTNVATLKSFLSENKDLLSVFEKELDKLDTLLN
ncbi:uncharacterized protein CXorf38 homolog [Hyperolius riggenbachi]|uniref:uncharacterized protein CXorf38 homolog n=1 Tax=Hyperolius riggenbachi TaxID=752182 RepID=UPI0035A2AD15